MISKTIKCGGGLSAQDDDYFRKLREKAALEEWASEKWYRKLGLLLYRWVVEPILSILKLIVIVLLVVLIPMILLAIMEGAPPWWKLL